MVRVGKLEPVRSGEPDAEEVRVEAADTS